MPNMRDAWERLIQRFFQAAAPPFLLPVGIRIYAIGDIHGCGDLLDQLLALIDVDSAGTPDHKLLVFLGDYIDRGPDSRAVLERMVTPFDGYEVHCLSGNHEQAALTFLKDPDFYQIWRTYGGRETLLSYGIRPPRLEYDVDLRQLQREFAEALPSNHLDFLNHLAMSITIGGYFFSHAGIRPGVPLDRQVPEDLIWIRDEFLESGADHGKVVVHGHSATPEIVVRQNRVGIDTGAYATGRLTAAVLERGGVRFLQT